MSSQGKEIGKLKEQIRDIYVKEFLGSGELWYNYFWGDENERKADEESVKSEAEEMFFELIDKLQQDLKPRFDNEEIVIIDIKKWEEWFGK